MYMSKHANDEPYTFRRKKVWPTVHNCGMYEKLLMLYVSSRPEATKYVQDS
jgi:hypothetical protein